MSLQNDKTQPPSWAMAEPAVVSSDMFYDNPKKDPAKELKEKKLQYARELSHFSLRVMNSPQFAEFLTWFVGYVPRKYEVRYCKFPKRPVPSVNGKFCRKDWEIFWSVWLRPLTEDRFDYLQARVYAEIEEMISCFKEA